MRYLRELLDGLRAGLVEVHELEAVQVRLSVRELVGGFVAAEDNHAELVRLAGQHARLDHRPRSQRTRVSLANTHVQIRHITQVIAVISAARGRI